MLIEKQEKGVDWRNVAAGGVAKTHVCQRPKDGFTGVKKVLQSPNITFAFCQSQFYNSFIFYKVVWLKSVLFLMSHKRRLDKNSLAS